MGELLVEKSDFVATITLNRPERLNAITTSMLSALSEALVDADKDPEVRVVILTGAGRGFCAGLDLRDQASGQGIGSQSGVAAAVGRFDLRDAPPTVLHSLPGISVTSVTTVTAHLPRDVDRPARTHDRSAHPRTHPLARA